MSDDPSSVADALDRIADLHRQEASVWRNRGESDMEAFHVARAEMIATAARLLRDHADTTNRLLTSIHVDTERHPVGLTFTRQLRDEDRRFNGYLLIAVCVISLIVVTAAVIVEVTR